MSNKRLLSKLHGGVRHANGDNGEPTIDIGMPVQTDNALVTLGPGKYNPQFKANITLQFLTLYFTESGGTYTPITAAALLLAEPTLANDTLPFFVFGNDDFESGYANLRDSNPVAVWAYNAPVIFGKDYPFSSLGAPWDANVTSLLRTGDVVLPFTATLGGVDYMALKVVRSSTVKYASLLNATQSNTFLINMIRYVVADDSAAQLDQYNNAIQIVDLSMFGAKNSDKIEPDNFRNPEQERPEITDIDCEININKQKALAVLGNYDVVSFRWSVFILSANKIL